MWPSTSSPPPTGLTARFGLLIGAIVWGLGDSLERQRRFGWGEAWLTPMADLLRGYLFRTLARFTALHTSFLAGTLPAAPRRRSAPRPAEGTAAERPRRARKPPAIPPGPVFVEYGMRPYDLELARLLDDPEMRAFLAAVPQAGRLLRPLWRKLSPQAALPDILRLPPRPRKPRPPRPAKPKPAPGSGPPGLRRVRLPDGTRSWEPIPCYPAGAKPPRLRRRAVDPWLIEPDPPQAPPPRRPPVRPPRPPNPERRLSDYNWIGRLMMR